MSVRARSLLLASMLLFAAACGRCNGEPAPTTGDDSKPSDPAAPTEPAKRPMGIVTGVVRLAAGASLPSYTIEQMEKQALTQAERAKPPDTCSPPKQNDRTPILLGEDNVLSNVVVAASGFKQAPSVRPPLTLDAKIIDCRLEPRVLLAQVGDTLRVRNEVGNYPFMPAYGAIDTVKTLLPNQTYDVTIDKPGVATLACGFTAPCGRTDVITLQHNFAALTDAKGSFRFEAFPADEPITLSAWHPLFKEATVQVTVGAGEQKTVELVLTPAAPPVPAAPAAPSAPASPTKPH